jgi:hypothetical protein
MPTPQRAERRKDRSQYGFDIPREQSEWLDRRAERLMVSRSAVLRFLIAEAQQQEQAAGLVGR